MTSTTAVDIRRDLRFSEEVDFDHNVRPHLIGDIAATAVCDEHGLVGWRLHHEDGRSQHRAELLWPAASIFERETNDALLPG